MAFFRTVGSIVGGGVGSVGGPVVGYVGSKFGAAFGEQFDPQPGSPPRTTQARHTSAQASNQALQSRQLIRTRGGQVLNIDQVRMVAIITDTLQRARLPWPLSAPSARWGLSMAMTANAYAESALSPTAAGDGGWSIGLFQCNRKAGAGRGHSVAQLEDPRYNTAVILGELVAAIDAFRVPLQRGTTAIELAALFSTYVERPADKAGEETRRKTIVVRLFGEYASEMVRA